MVINEVDISRLRKEIDAGYTPSSSTVIELIALVERLAKQLASSE